MKNYNFWFNPLNYYYLNNVPINKETIDLQMEDRLDILQREKSMLELQNKIEQQRYTMVNTNNLLANKNITYDKPKEIEPFIIVYKSRPIQGIVLELWGKNPEYSWEVDMEEKPKKDIDEWGSYQIR